MTTFDVTVVKETKTIEATLSGKLDDSVELAVTKLISAVEENPGYSLIINVTDLDMPGMSAFSMAGKLMDDRMKEAQRKLKAVAIVDAGKITDFLPMFFIKPPENIFFMTIESAREYLAKIG